MPLRPHAVVLGLDSITGLQTARILARRGVPVVALAKDPGHYCCRTRVCERILRADTDSEELIGALEALGPELGERAVLFPCTDMAVYHASLHRGRLEPWYHVVLPGHEVVERLMNKLSFCEHAQEHGHPIPRTFILTSRTEAEEAAEALAFPAVLKPGLRTPEWDRHVGEKAFKPAAAGVLLDLYDRTARWTKALVAQEWIPGSESSLYSCNCYFDADSKPLVTFVARKIRQWPPQTGISSLGEECRNDVVLEETLRLFQGVGFRGLAYLEMKRHEETGEHFIIEPNVGRPTGRSAIAETGGVELLYTKYCDVLGLPLPSSRVQRYAGAKWIYARSDLQSAFHYWRRDELTIPEWWRSVRGLKTDAVISWRDPAPFLFELWRGARLLAAPARVKAGGEVPARRPAAPTTSRDGTPPLRLEPAGSLDELREEWTELAGRTENIFATWEWAAIWWKHFGAHRRLLLSACRDPDGRLVAILPLHISSAWPLRIVRFVGHGAGDELGPICAPADRVAAAGALRRSLLENRWDVFLGERLPGDGWSSLLGARTLRHEASPILRFATGEDGDPFSAWSSKLQKQLRYEERRLRREHELSYRLADAPEHLAADMDTLFALHSARWEEAGSTFATAHAAFHREFAECAMERGWLRLWFLEIDGEPVASLYGFRFAGVESHYQGGRDSAWQRHSVGSLLLAHSIREAYEDGMEEWRFLRGEDEYKYRFASGDPGLETVGIGRGPLGRAAVATSAMLRRRLGRALVRQWLLE